MPIPKPSSSAGSEHLLRQLRSDLEPAAGAKARVQKMIRAELRAPKMLEQARSALTPAPGLMTQLWEQILSSVDPLAQLSLWDRMRQAFNPTEAIKDLVWARLLSRLEPAYSPIFVGRPIKWAAAFAVVLVSVRMSPMLFLAPASIAESSVTLLAREGNVEVLLGSLWQPMTGEITLHAPTRLQTQTAKATIIDHDDAVFRFASATRGTLRDLSDRPESSLQEATIDLETGELWVLGLVPKHVRGVTVVTTQGRITVHEGSVSIKQVSNGVLVRVFDRSAIVARHGKQLGIMAGQQTLLTRDGDLVASTLDNDQFHETWVADNLMRDAAHQREIAQLQQERRAASAGILPSSRFYPVKRLAENVDVLFSLSEEERARKLITQANTRLNEAAALLQNASTGSAEAADTALQEYKDTMLQVASGSGGSPLVQSLLQKEVVDAGSATVAAALPGDSAYALKQTIDETIQALPAGLEKPNMDGEVLLDQLAAVKRQAAQGDTAVAKEKLAELADSIASLDSTGALTLVSAELREEAKAVAIQVSVVVQGPAEGVGLTLGVPPKELVTPQHPSRPYITRPMTGEQVAAKAQEIRGRVFLYGTKKAQYDALADQISLLIRNPDRGRILRELAKVMPRNGLAQRVLREIQTVQEEVLQEVTASGGTATH